LKGSKKAGRTQKKGIPTPTPGRDGGTSVERERRGLLGGHPTSPLERQRLVVTCSVRLGPEASIIRRKFERFAPHNKNEYRREHTSASGLPVYSISLQLI
jgi:hypothetical protein